VIFEQTFDRLRSVAPERTLREYWIRIAVDGNERVIRRVADGPESAGREFLRDLHRGGRQAYDSDQGKLTIEWGNVAMLEIGPVVRSAAITPEIPDAADAGDMAGGPTPAAGAAGSGAAGSG
jgi:hypothetical protein